VEERRGERTHGRAPATYPPGLPGRRCAAARCVARPPFFVFLSLLLFFIRTNAQNGWSDAPRRHLPPLPPPPAPPLPRPRKAKTLLPALPVPSLPPPRSNPSSRRIPFPILPPPWRRSPCPSAPPPRPDHALPSTPSRYTNILG
jgi:hypothetical protein